jgi:cellulose synthase/poly-beta-1,6-N-acetylglucosamine synthase-like glycosyltransferase
MERGGFSSHLHLASGDDDLFVNAAAHAGNTVLCLQSAAHTYTQAPDTWAGWLRQKRRHLSTGSTYRYNDQVLLAAMGGSWAMHYGLGCILLLAGYFEGWVILAYLLRMSLLLYQIRRILKVLHYPLPLWQVPWWDGLLAIYYGGVVPSVLLLPRSRAW